MPMQKFKPTKLGNTPNWEYRIDKKHLKDPSVERWLLERQLNYGGDVKIKLRTLLAYWPDVYVGDPIFRNMIERFLKTDYAKQLIKKQRISYSH